MKKTSIKKIYNDDCIQAYYTFVVEEKNQKQVVKGYANIIEELLLHHETIIYEKLFGSPSTYRDIEKVRNDFYEKMKIQPPPFNFLIADNEQTAVLKGMIYTLKYEKKEGENVIFHKKNGCTYAVSYKIDNVRKLYYSGLSEEPCRIPNMAETLNENFKQLQVLMAELGMKNQWIARTWFYLEDIAKNYEDFNKQRRNFFDSIGVAYSDESNELPASTCIGVKSISPGNCSMNVYCVDMESGVDRARIYNSDQNEANGSTYQFRPTFSRAVCLRYSGYTELQISGTASINEMGRSVFLDDTYQQIKKTLRNINNLLKSVNMDYSDITFSTCFFKNAVDIDLFYRVKKEMKLCDFPTICIVGDVCREELLFEMDAIAVRQTESVRT